MLKCMTVWKMKQSAFLGKIVSSEWSNEAIPSTGVWKEKKMIYDSAPDPFLFTRWDGWDGTMNESEIEGLFT